MGKRLTRAQRRRPVIVRLEPREPGKPLKQAELDALVVALIEKARDE